MAAIKDRWDSHATIMRGTLAAAHDPLMKRPPILHAYAIATTIEPIFYALHEDGGASASVRAGARWEPSSGAFFEIGSPAVVNLESGCFIGGIVIENAVRILGPQPRPTS
ncbi:hypothetical protein SAMN05216368_10938 [Cryobacterium flavum]|uniref:Uncharacterized protein n=2 Tax=Cryobacterium flavum TaxID=1424659 RepID=A0A5E9G0R4_9MICO|nr:hypothetical protein SAMN05216368_10938 [Cryobacterium flavum]